MSEDVTEKETDRLSKKSKKPPAQLTGKEEMGEFVKTALWAIALALLIRSVFLEPFNIPSSSMVPTLLKGDYLFVNKPAYGYSRFSFPFGIAPIEDRIWAQEPKRGDVIVFRLPLDTNTNFIKRLVGMPGDVIQMSKGRLYINGEQVPREFVRTIEVVDDLGRKTQVSEYIETLPGNTPHLIHEVSDHESEDQTNIYTVPTNHYFMMGDNRDMSRDSRFENEVGPVPFENIVGRADFLFFSTNGHAQFYEFWKWPWSIRYERIFMDIDPVRPDEKKNSAGDSVGVTSKAIASER